MPAQSLTPTRWQRNGPVGSPRVILEQSPPIRLDSSRAFHYQGVFCDKAKSGGGSTSGDAGMPAMRIRCAIWVIGLGLSGSSGCMLAEQGVHVVAYKVQQRLQEHSEQSRNRKWADEAWQSTCTGHPDL